RIVSLSPDPDLTCQDAVMQSEEFIKREKLFDALEWLAAMCSHVPNKGEQMVRYYGYYSNVSRGRRQKGNLDGLIPYIIEQEENSKEYRKNWARLIENRGPDNQRMGLTWPRTPVGVHCLALSP
ncbi:MAG: transposase, partial [Deltaproteobacteria bacterium]